jgi:hypothetical protein
MRGSRSSMAVVLLLALWRAAPAQQPPPEPPQSALDRTRTVLEKWVETQRLISQERRDWQLDRELLLDRIALIERERDSLRERTGAVDAQVATAEAGKAEAAAENERLVQATAGLRERIAVLEARTAELVTRLPDPLRERLRPLSEQLPKSDQAPQRPLGERFQTVLGLLHEIHKSNREIAVATEIRPLGDGTTLQVTTLYLGIGQGYYVDSKGQAAGVGVPTADGWAWTPANEIAPQVTAAVAMVRNEGIVPAFVRLPVRLRDKRVR